MCVKVIQSVRPLDVRIASVFSLCYLKILKILQNLWKKVVFSNVGATFKCLSVFTQVSELELCDLKQIFTKLD